MISSELPEVMGMSDRIIVMSEGLQVAQWQRADFNAEKLSLRPVEVSMKKLFTSREALLFMLIVAMLLSVGSVAKDFLSLTNLLSAYNDTSILIILALGTDAGDYYPLYRLISGSQFSLNWYGGSDVEQ